MSEDPLLKNINGISSGLLNGPYADGLLILSLTDGEIVRLGAFINNFYDKKSKKEGKTITRNALTMLQGGVFAIGTRTLKNPEWEEHCASSLREVFHEWPAGDISHDFSKYYRSGVRLRENEKASFQILKERYSFFTGVAHHEGSRVMFALRSIRKDESLKLKDCYTDGVFIEEVKNFFIHLMELVSSAEEQYEST